jgi:hypothetical protein
VWCGCDETGGARAAAKIAIVGGKDAIKAAVDSIDSQFVASGSVPVADGVVITLKAGGETVTLPVSREAVEKGSLAPLLAATTASPFGAGSKTVIDPAVRKATHLLPEQFELAGFDLATSGIIEQIRTTLVPDAAAVRPELLKLNVYTAGGHFAAHRDTPRAETQFGSLVVCLPAPFSGGSLSVIHEGKQGHFDWGKDTAPPMSYYQYGQETPEQLAKKQAFVPPKTAKCERPHTLASPFSHFPPVPKVLPPPAGGEPVSRPHHNCTTQLHRA